MKFFFWLHHLKKKRLRTQFITHWKIQLNLAGIVASSFIFFLSIVGAIFLWTWLNISMTTGGLTTEERILAKFLLLQQSRHLYFYFAGMMTVYVISISAFLIIFTHRLTGPVYRLTKVLDEAVETGKWPESIRFRTTDAFPDLEISFNEFLDEFHDRVTPKKKPPKSDNPYANEVPTAKQK